MFSSSPHPPFVLTENFSCTTGTADPHYPISAWTFYFVAMLFDCLALSISTVCLLKVKARTATASA